MIDFLFSFFLGQILRRKVHQETNQSTIHLLLSLSLSVDVCFFRNGFSSPFTSFLYNSLYSDGFVSNPVNVEVSNLMIHRLHVVIIVFLLLQTISALVAEQRKVASLFYSIH